MPREESKRKPVLPTESTALLLPAFTSPKYARNAFSTNDIDLHAESSITSPHARSVPCLRPYMDIMPMSPLFYKQHYMASGGTMTSSSFNLACSTLGAGTLALPHAIHDSGIFIGFFSLSFICWCTIYSVYLLGKVYDRTGLGTIEELVHVFVSPAAAKLAAFFIVVFCWGVAVMYVVMMGDFVEPLAPLVGPLKGVGRHTLMLLFWATIMLPLSMLREVTSLRHASIMGTGSTLILAVSLLVKVKDTPSANRTVDFVNLNWGTISAVSTFMFSFCCQPIVLPVYTEMKNATIGRLSMSATYSMVVCTVIYLVSGICGAIAYGADAKPNILVNFGDQLNVPYVLFSYIGMAMSVTLAFPMAVFPTRDSLVMLLGYQDKATTPTWVVRGVGAGLALLALLLGMFVPNVRILFDVLGGMCGGIISFLFPGILALRADAWSGNASSFHITMTWGLVVLGVVMCLLGSYNTIRTNFLPKKFENE